MRGDQFAVIGLGRSGVGAAEAVLAAGGHPTVYDQRTDLNPDQILAKERLEAKGVEVVTAWDGRFSPFEYEALIPSPGVPRSHEGIQDVLRAGKPIWSEIELAYRVSDAPIVAVTGTNGKSTTVVLTWLLVAACSPSRLCGNLSGSGYPEETLTEAAVAATEQDVLVAEVSSFQLEWVDAFRPQAAAITNITPDHLDRHPSFEDYQQTKLRLFARQQAEDCAVVNLSEPSLPVDFLLPYVPGGVETRFIGREGSEAARTTFGDSRWILDGYGELARDCLPLFGRHQAVNFAMAWELAMGILGDAANPEAMLAAIKGFRGLAHRMERVAEWRGVTIINNSMCTNPAAVIANAESLPMRQILLMGGSTKGLDFEPLRRYLDRAPHRVILFGPKLPGGLHEQLGPHWPAMERLEDAFALAMQEAQAGEAVVLSPGCASAAPYTHFRERGAAFQEIVASWIKEHHG